MIRFACPGCNVTYSVTDEKAGKTGKCPKCEARFVIPAAEPTVAPPPVPPPPPPAPPSEPAAAGEPVEIAPCPTCQARLSVAASDVGLDVECPYCKAVYQAVAATPGRTDGGGDRPSSRSRADDDRPSRRGRRDDDDRPSRRGRRDEDEDEDDDRPSRRSRRDDDDRPSRRGRSSGPSRSRRQSTHPARVASGSLSIFIGIINLMCGIAFLAFGGSVVAFLNGLQAPAGADPNAAANARAAAGGVMAVIIGCGLVVLLLALLYLSAGIGALMRTKFGRVATIICSVLSAIYVLLLVVGLGLSLLNADIKGICGGLVQLAVVGAHAWSGFMTGFGAASEDFN